jgi:hypothetical protein
MFFLRFWTSQGLLSPAELEVRLRFRAHASLSICMGADRHLVFVRLYRSGAAIYQVTAVVLWRLRAVPYPQLDERF